MNGIETLTVREIALLMHVSTRTVHRWIKAEKLPSWRIGRKWVVSRAYFEGFIAGLQPKGETIEKIPVD